MPRDDSSTFGVMPRYEDLRRSMSNVAIIGKWNEVRLSEIPRALV